MKKTNNKGFSLVELIVVIAIMAVLMVVVGPQLLKNVEKSRIQRDNSAIAEIANAVKIAVADEEVNKAVAASDSIEATAGKFTFNSAGDALDKELYSTLGAEIKLTSNAYTKTGATQPKLTITKSGLNVTIKGENLVEPKDGTTPLTITY